MLIEHTQLARALVTSPAFGPNLRCLLADQAGTGWITDLFSIPAADAMIKDARRLADYVVIDSPPLNEVVDALPLARQADYVLLVARIGVRPGSTSSASSPTFLPRATSSQSDSRSSALSVRDAATTATTPPRPTERRRAGPRRSPQGAGPGGADSGGRRS